MPLRKTYLFLLIVIAWFNISAGQQSNGFIRIESDKNWIISIGDSLFSNGENLKLPAGKYNFQGRPQISYNWPAIIIDGQITILSDDTVKIIPQNYLLNTTRVINPIEPKIYDYEAVKKDDYKKTTYLKNSLLFSAIVTNWLSFYLKREADGYYKQYGQAQSGNDIRKFKKKFNDYDDYSQIVLGISSAILSGYIYLSLTD